MGSSRDIDQNNASDNGNDAGNFENPERFAEKNDPHACDERRSDATPNGIGHTDLDFSQAQCQEIETDAVEHPHQHGWREFRET